MSALTSIDGAISGLNTTDIVDSIIKFERQPVVLLENDKTLKTNIVSTLQAFQAKLLALSSQVKQLTRSSTFEQTQIDYSEEGYVTASASGRVGSGSYDVQVLSLARNHQIASQGFSDQSLASFGAGTITLSLGDGASKAITIDSSNNSLVGIKNAINQANAGVTATIINDGSDSNAYRLVLTGNKTGKANKISVSSNLSGEVNLNFSTATFDQPETLSMASSSTSQIDLGSTAAFTGTGNKTYTFTVRGTGTQTIGTDNITIDWTDGTNSGSILVTQADSEVELVGDGADGMKLTFSAGDLNAGDTFEVSSFAPLLQDPSDAVIAVGSSGSGGSPITVRSETNTFADAIGGLQLNVTRETEAGQSITINTDVDVSGVREAINGLISKFNDAIDFVDEQNKYNQDTGEAGVLFGDLTLQTMQNSMRSSLTSVVSGLDSKYNQLFAIGVRSGTDGKLSIADSSRFESALRNNLDDVINMFTDAGTSSSNYVEFVSSSASSKVGSDYDVNITQAATQGTLRGSSIDNPSTTPLTITSSNNQIKLKVSGIESETIRLSEGTYNSTDDLVHEIQSQIDADEKIGTRGIKVKWVEVNPGSGYLEITNSSYGSASKVEMVTSVGNSALSTLGLSTAVSTDGVDVQGTINGEEAEGRGQYLTGKDGNETTDGLKLLVTLTEDQLGDGAEATVGLSKGVASKLYTTLDSLTKSGDGMMDRRIKSYQNQVKDLTERITFYDERLAARREILMAKFTAMEAALSDLKSTGDYLTSQMASMNDNWNFNSSSN